MGGGFSKQSPIGHATSYTFHPIRRKSEENNSKSEQNNSKSEKNNSSQENTDHVITDLTLSAKLLDNQRKNKDGGHYLNYNEKAQNFSSPRRSVSSPTSTEHTFKQQKESAHVFESNNSTPNRNGQDEDDHEGESNYNEESDDDYGRRISDYDGLIGSPSFREYCEKDYLKTDSNTCDGEKIETKTGKDKFNASSKTKKDSTPMLTKKERRRRRIKKVISIGNPSAMRNLLHVAACYNPTISTSGQKLPKPI